MTELSTSSPSLSQSGGLRIEPLTTTIGAVLHGIDLARPLTAEQVRDVRAALLRHRVVFFRGQQIGHAEHLAFARRFGEPTYAHPHDEHPAPGFPEISTVAPERYEERFGPGHTAATRSYAVGWHSDVTAAVNPPWASVLRAEHVPAVGGDTHWTDLVAAYRALSPSLRRLAARLRAEHRYDAAAIRHGARQHERFRRNPLISHHPVVRVHPETGEHALYVNPAFTSRILDVTPRESERLLGLFFDLLALPEHTVRFRWEPGDVAFWDNRSTAHLAPRDLARCEGPRVLHRITLTGDVPVGPDGTTSVAIAGAPFGARELFHPSHN